jgi:L-rhamnonate dehydratase
MNRRSFFGLAAGAATAPLIFGDEKSNLKITSVRLMNPQSKHPLPAYSPAANAWSTNGVEVASPMSIYPEYKAMRSLFMPDPGKMPGFFVEIGTDKGIKGYGPGGPGGGPLIEQHFTKLLMGKDPFDIERNWDILWRSSMSYDRAGIGMHAISGVDLALWDIVGKALNTPVYKLIGGETKPRIPAYCTGNDIDQHLDFGFRRVKLAIAYGPAMGAKACGKISIWSKVPAKKLGPMETSCSIAGCRGPSSTRLKWRICWGPTGSTGWKNACSRTITKASRACMRRSKTYALRPASTNTTGTASASYWNIVRPASGSRTCIGAAD